MKIAFTSPEFVTEENFHGGLSNYLYNVTSYLTEQHNHNVHVFTLSHKSQILRYRGVTVHRVKRSGRLLHHWILTKLTRRLLGGKFDTFYKVRNDSMQICKAFIKEHQKSPFAIAQAASYLHTGYELTKLHPRPCPIVTRFSSSQQLWNAAYGCIYTPTTAMLHSMEILQAHHSDGCFSPSRMLTCHLQPLVGKEVKVIESPVDLSRCSSDYSIYNRYAEGKRYLLFFGTLGRLKGIGVIADILAGILEAYPDMHFIFVGKDVGLGGERAVDILMQRSGAHSSRGIHIPPIPRKCLIPMIQNSEAVVLPSIVDNIPNACIESMASGAVTIGTRGASFEEIIEDGHNGFLAEVEDCLTLRHAIDRALALTPAEKKAIGAAARKAVISLVPSSAVEKLNLYYQKVLEMYNRSFE